MILDRPFRCLFVVFSAVLCIAIPVRGGIPLGNLFDDAKGTDLTTAIGTDTYQAEGATTDLGVVADVIDGQLGVGTQTIAPGVVFNMATAGGGTTAAVAGRPSNDTYRSNVPNAIRATGVATPPSTKVEDGIGMHADELITFDLDEIRAAGDLGAGAAYFTAKAGLNDTAAPGNGDMHTVAILSDGSGNVLGGFVNGQPVVTTQSAGVWSVSGTLPTKLYSTGNNRWARFALWIPAEARYLTLATTTNGVGSSDHGVFSGATLELQAIPLSNLFDDPKGTALNAAILSDTLQAGGDAADLGVELCISGGMENAVTIAPGITFNLTNIADVTPPNGVGNVPGNDTWRSSANQPIRTRGLSYTGMNGIKVEDGIGMQADGLIMFDLDELRQAGEMPLNTEFQFRARAGINDDVSSTIASVRATAIISDGSGHVLGAWVNGQVNPVVNTAGVWSLDFGGVPGELTKSNGIFADFNVLVPGAAKYLTLVGTGGSSVDYDHVAFSGARLIFNPVPEPGSMLLLAVGATGLFITVWRRGGRN